MKDKAWFENRVAAICRGIKHPTDQNVQRDAEGSLCDLVGQLLFDLHKLANKTPERFLRKGDE